MKKRLRRRLQNPRNHLDIAVVSLDLPIVFAAINQAGLAILFKAFERAADGRRTAAQGSADASAAPTLIRQKHDAIADTGVGVLALFGDSLEFGSRLSMKYDPSRIHCWHPFRPGCRQAIK